MYYEESLFGKILFIFRNNCRCSGQHAYYNINTNELIVVKNNACSILKQEWENFATINVTGIAVWNYILNEEFLVNVGHQPTLIQSLLFVHTARRSYQWNEKVNLKDFPFNLGGNLAKPFCLQEGEVVTRSPQVNLRRDHN